MNLLDYLVTSDTRKALLRLFVVDGVEASIHDLHQMAKASYAVTHQELKAMGAEGLVRSHTRGKAKVYSLNTEYPGLELLKTLYGASAKKPAPKSLKHTLASLSFYGAPVLSEVNKAEHTLEEALALGVLHSQEESYLLRALTVALWKNRHDMDWDKLWHYCHQYKVKRHMGFLLELTGSLSQSHLLSRKSKRFKDTRHKKAKSYFKSKYVRKAQKLLEERNTPKLAKKWNFTMNMGMDSFQSFFKKYKVAS